MDQLKIGYHCTMQGNIDRMQNAAMNAIDKLGIKTNIECIQRAHEIAKHAIENQRNSAIVSELPFNYFLIDYHLHFVSHRAMSLVLRGEYLMKDFPELHTMIMGYKIS